MPLVHSSPDRSAPLSWRHPKLSCADGTLLQMRQLRLRGVKSRAQVHSIEMTGMRCDRHKSDVCANLIQNTL